MSTLTLIEKFIMSIETTDKLKDFQNELNFLLKKYNAKLYPVNKNSYNLFQLIDGDLSIIVEIDNI